MPNALQVMPQLAEVPKEFVRDATLRRERSAGAQALIEAFRLHGYRRAAVNPLDSHALDVDRRSINELDPRTYGLALNESVNYSVDFGGGTQVVDQQELLRRLRSSYCGFITLDSAHVRAADQRRWLYSQMETINDAEPLAAAEAMRLLSQLAAAEAYEHFQRAHFAKLKQFSLEGSESLVPLLSEVIDHGRLLGVEEIVLGMPHRGRLNIVKNVLAMPMEHVLSLLSGNPHPSLAAWDIKDHIGLSTRIGTAHGELRVLLAHNPSHLESISPVVCGMARALQDRKSRGGLTRKVMPVLVHGDAAFSGQGIVPETLNLSQTRGYNAGGTVHIILNNQIGSTVSDPLDARSTLYGADLARAVDAPILHVNADEPEAVLAAARLATAYRMKFAADIVVDHIGYRRHGHFGGDDPTMTQPAMQRRIRSHRSVVWLYADKLAQRGMAKDGEAERASTAAWDAMKTAVHNAANAPAATPPPRLRPTARDKRFINTTVPLAQLRAMLLRMATIPTGFTLHADIAKMQASWREIADTDNRPVDWRLAENLAYGTLLANGFNVRLSGLDVGRGSFFHRQAVWHDQSADVDGQSVHVPLRHIADPQGYFSIFESPLSEEAVLGFEYGYSLQCGRDLVVWEAQFGDFVNNAQVIIDQFIATGETKWGYASGLVVLLPHGHEGGGPEHSSAFIGRFLQLCADGNLQIAMPSTAAQLYHLLRRQTLMDDRKPLIVMTPKGWLHGQALSHGTLAELANGRFQPFIAERSDVAASMVQRVVLTSGKLYYDLVTERSRAGLSNVAIGRVEELYPFPVDELAADLRRYGALEEVVWAQEEAKNHGAWHLVRDQLELALPPNVSIRYAGRSPAAPTAVCQPRQHASEQHAVVTSALGLPA